MSSSKWAKITVLDQSKQELPELIWDLQLTSEELKCLQSPTGVVGYYYFSCKYCNQLIKLLLNSTLIILDHPPEVLPFIWIKAT